jgi:hypothetical protein
MYSTVTFEGNLADDVQIKENQAGGVYQWVCPQDQLA